MSRGAPIIVSIVAILLVLGVFLLQKRGSEQSPPGQEALSGLEKAPNFDLKDYKGNTVKLADLEGKPLVINSWAAWCPFCVKELSDFAKVQKEFGDIVVIIAIDRAESLETAKQYSDKLGVTNDLVFLLDPNDSFYQSIGGFSMPETIFVDGNGNVRMHKRGPMDIDEMRGKVEQLISL